MVFPLVMYGCKSWAVKKAEHWRIDAFELRCWRGLLRVPWTARRSNQSILKGISPGCSLEGLMLKLKLQYFDHLMGRNDSFEKMLIVEKIDGRRRRGQQRMRWLDGITSSMDNGLGGLQELVLDWEAWRVEVHRVTKSQIRLSNWTKLNINQEYPNGKTHKEDFNADLPCPFPMETQRPHHPPSTCSPTVRVHQPGRSQTLMSRIFIEISNIGKNELLVT